MIKFEFRCPVCEFRDFWSADWLELNSGKAKCSECGNTMEEVVFKDKGSDQMSEEQKREAGEMPGAFMESLKRNNKRIKEATRARMVYFSHGPATSEIQETMI